MHRPRENAPSNQQSSSTGRRRPQQQVYDALLLQSFDAAVAAAGDSHSSWLTCGQDLGAAGGDRAGEGHEARPAPTSEPAWPASGGATPPPPASAGSPDSPGTGLLLPHLRSAGVEGTSWLTSTSPTHRCEGMIEGLTLGSANRKWRCKPSCWIVSSLSPHILRRPSQLTCLPALSPLRPNLLQRVPELALPGRLLLPVPLPGLPRPEHQRQQTSPTAAPRQPRHAAAAAAGPPGFGGSCTGSRSGRLGSRLVVPRCCPCPAAGAAAGRGAR